MSHVRSKTQGSKTHVLGRRPKKRLRFRMLCGKTLASKKAPLVFLAIEMLLLGARAFVQVPRVQKT